MKIGDLVRWELIERCYWLAIVVEEPYNDSDKALVVVKWLRGNWIGLEDYIVVKELEVIG